MQLVVHDYVFAVSCTDVSSLQLGTLGLFISYPISKTSNSKSQLIAAKSNLISMRVRPLPRFRIVVAFQTPLSSTHASRMMKAP